MIKRIVSKVGIWLLLIISLILLLLLIAQWKPVQQVAARQVISWLGEKLDTEVQVEEFAWKRFQWLEMKGVLLRDQQADTLLAINRLSAHFSPLKLLRNQVVADQIRLSGVVVNLNRDSTGQSNYDFISQAFSSTAPQPDTIESPNNWQIQPDRISLEKARFTYLDQMNSTELTAAWAEMKARIQSFDLAAQSLVVDRLEIDRPLIHYLDSDVKPTKDTVQASIQPPAFPDLGWEIQILKSVMDRGQLAYDKGIQDSTRSAGFDPTHINLAQIHWNIEEVQVQDKKIAATIRSLALAEGSGFVLEQLQGELVCTDTLTAIKNFALQTPNSEIRQSSMITYPSWGALLSVIDTSQLYLPEDIGISVQLDQLSISPVDFAFLHPALASRLATSPLEASLDIQGSLANVVVKELELKQGQGLRLKGEGRIREILDPDQLNFDLEIIDLAASLKPFLRNQPFSAGLEDWGLLQLRAKVYGDLKALQIRALQFQSRNGPFLAGAISTKGLPDYQNAWFRFDLDTLHTKVQHWQGFTTQGLPGLLDSLGQLEMRGSIEGNIRQFATDLRLKSEAGLLQTNARFDFEQDYSNAKYSGDLQLFNMDWDKINKDSPFGVTTLAARFDGKGLANADWNTSLTAQLDDLSYEGYTFDQLLLEGALEPNLFQVEIRMDDPNLGFRSQSSIPIGDSTAAYQFDLQLGTCNLPPLGLSNTPLALSLDLEADIKDFKADQLDGRLLCSDLVIQDALHIYRTDSIVAVATSDESGNRSLELDSDVLQFNLQGHYQLSQISNDLLAWAGRYFPLHELMSTQDSLDWLADTHVKASLHIKDPTPLTQIVLPDLTKLDRLDMGLAFQPASRSWNFELDLPALQYASLRVDSLRIRSAPGNSGLRTTVRAQQLQSGENLKLPSPSLQAFLRNDSLWLDVKSFEQVDSLIWGAAGTLAAKAENWRFRFDPIVRLNGVDWAIDPGHQMVYQQTTGWKIDGFELKNGAESVRIDGASGNGPAQDSVVALRFDQFGIGIFNPLLDLPSDYLKGALQGQLRAQNFLSNLSYIADINLLNWQVDTVAIGNLELKAQQSPDQPLILFSSTLEGKDNNLSMKGTYSIDNQYYDLDTWVQKLPMQTLEPFLSGWIHDSEGYLDGRLSVKGQASQTKLDGRMQLHGVKTTVDYLNIPYELEEASIDITDRVIHFGELKMKDAEGRSASLSGKIEHQFFDQMALDLNFTTDRFQFLNTTAKDNELFYGQLFLKSDMSVRGPIDKPQFFINAVTTPGTRFYTVPLTEEEAITQEDFIIFGRPGLDSLGRDTNYLNNHQLTLPGIDLQLNLELTKDAELQVIVDPLSGDKLVCKGTSNLTVGMDAAKNIRITGSYELTEGQYSFSYEQLIKKDFSIRPGSKITFNGDPLRAQLDITAAYQTRVDINSLVASQSSDEATSTGIQRANVQVLMKISGDLLEPVLTFDIVLVDDPQGTVANAVENRLRQLRNNETELNTQVFGLLFFNNFIVAQNNRQNISEAGETALLSSVSRLVSNQLNKLAGRWIKGVDLSLGVQAYRPGIDPTGADLATEVQVGLSKGFFNDRLNVKVGGNIDVGTGTGEQDVWTSFTGDFVLEYRLSPTGNYLLRVYRRSNYDVLNEGNVSRSGAGISVRKSFKNKVKKRKK